MEVMLTIAHLSDTHFGGHPSAESRARRVLAHLAAMDPGVDVVLVTGDIADHGTHEEYVEAAEVLGSWAGPAPVLTCPGNHDIRNAYLAGLRPSLGAVTRADEAYRVGGALFVMLDSLVAAPEGERIDHGELAPESLEFLDHQLAGREEGEPAYVCLHHPPVPVHIDLMDPIRLREPEALAAVLGSHDDVRAVLVGHAHTMCASTFAGLPMLVGGGVASTVTLDAEDLPLITHELGPSYAVHIVGDDGRVVTHWRTL
jgi:Icc protein